MFSHVTCYVCHIASPFTKKPFSHSVHTFSHSVHTFSHSVISNLFRYHHIDVTNHICMRAEKIFRTEFFPLNVFQFKDMKQIFFGRITVNATYLRQKNATFGVLRKSTQIHLPRLTDLVHILLQIHKLARLNSWYECW